MNCYECPNAHACDVATCPYHPVWITITAYGDGRTYRDPHIENGQRKLFELDNVLYPPDEAQALVNLGFARLRDVTNAIFTVTE